MQLENHLCFHIRTPSTTPFENWVYFCKHFQTNVIDKEAANWQAKSHLVTCSNSYLQKTHQSTSCQDQRVQHCDLTLNLAVTCLEWVEWPLTGPGFSYGFRPWDPLPWLSDIASSQPHTQPLTPDLRHHLHHCAAHAGGVHRWELTVLCSAAHPASPASLQGRASLPLWCLVLCLCLPVRHCTGKQPTVFGELFELTD